MKVVGQRSFFACPSSREEMMLSAAVAFRSPSWNRALANAFMGLVRGLTAQQKRKVSEIREKKGMRAAIAAAKRAGAAKK